MEDQVAFSIGDGRSVIFKGINDGRALGISILEEIPAGSQIIGSVVLRGRDTDSSLYVIPVIDFATHEIVTMQGNEADINQGYFFTSSHSKDVPNLENLDIEIDVPNTTKLYGMYYEYDVEAESNFTLYEGITSSGGTPLAIINRDRNSTNSPSLTVVHTPTITNTGTAIFSWHIGSGKSVGGGGRVGNKFLMKRNTKYLFRFSNVTSSANYMSTRFDWSERESVS